MAKWAVKDQAEFEARQMAFEFAEACRFVAQLAADTKKRLAAMFSKWKKGFVSKTLFKKPHQLVLELDSIAQLPLPFSRSVSICG